MTSLPPPRLPGQPPDRPPIRRPGDHLPRPEHVGRVDAAPAPRQDRHLGLLLAVLAAVVIVVASGVYLLIRDEDTGNLDTAGAAGAIDDVVGDGDSSGADVRCPIDDVDAVLASAFDPLDGDEQDELYDAIDLGLANNAITTESSATPASVSCAFLASPDARGTQFVAIVVTAEPDDFLRTVRDNASSDRGDVEQGRELHGGSFTRARLIDGENPTGYTSIVWADDEIAVGVVISGADAGDIELDDLEAGVGDVLPDVVDALAGPSD